MPLIFVLFAAVGVVLGLVPRMMSKEAWAEAARRLGATFEPTGMLGWPKIVGQFGDVAVTVRVHTTGGGKNSQRYTIYEVQHPPAGPAVTMTRQGVMSGLFGSLMGRTDVLVGDPMFDDSVIVETGHADAVREFLTPARRAVVQELFAVYERAEIEHDTMQVARRGVDDDAETIVATVRRLVDMAAVLGDVRVNTILGHRQDGHLMLAADELHDVNQERANRFTSTLEAEALAEAGHHDQAAKAFDELWSGQPDDPVSSGWYDLATTADPPPLVGGAAIGRSQQAIIEDVFAADRMSWEVVEHFEAAYRDTTVDWSGTVIRADSYEQDRDFDGGPGIKAVVLVGRAGRPGVTSNEVHAVVEFDVGAEVHEGRQVRFRGILANVDRFDRNIWVRHATLL